MFREHILQAKFEKIRLRDDESTDDSSDAMPSLNVEYNECLGANLQMMFALMKESVRKSIDPNFFIRAIGLDENMQQVLIDLLLSFFCNPSNDSKRKNKKLTKKRTHKSLVNYF